jgi:WD40 repeat protein
MSLKVSDGAITGLVCDENKQVLVCSCDEGIIASVKIRGGKVGMKSEQYETSFNCMGTFRQNTKLGIGDSTGKIYFFNWGEFGYHSDVYPGKIEAINAIIPITQKIGILGSDDGYLRAVHFYPHKYLGVVGRQQFPIEKMDVCNDGHLIGSISHDETVRFWNVSYFSGFTLPNEVEKKSAKNKETMKKHNLPSSNVSNTSEFYKGLAD